MTQDELKKAVAAAAVEFVVPGQVLGVGTGSTVDFFIDALAAARVPVSAAVSSSERSTTSPARLRHPRGGPQRGRGDRRIRGRRG